MSAPVSLSLSPLKKKTRLTGKRSHPAALSWVQGLDFELLVNGIKKGSSAKAASAAFRSRLSKAALYQRIAPTSTVSWVTCLSACLPCCLPGIRLGPSGEADLELDGAHKAILTPSRIKMHTNKARSASERCPVFKGGLSRGRLTRVSSCRLQTTAAPRPNPNSRSNQITLVHGAFRRTFDYVVRGMYVHASVSVRPSQLQLTTRSLTTDR